MSMPVELDAVSEVRQMVVDLSFHGERFGTHALGVSVLPEVTRAQELLIEVAKEVWRRRHPDRERLPGGFDEQHALGFEQVRRNCATLPLFRLDPKPVDDALFNNSDELDQAAELMADLITAAGSLQRLPEDFPKSLIGLFQEFGKTLKGDEWMELRPAGRKEAARFDGSVRDRLRDYADADSEAQVDFIGEVKMASVDRPHFRLVLANGESIEADAEPKHEAIITTALRDHATAKVHLVGQALISPAGKIKKVFRVIDLTPLSTGEIPFDHTSKPIWQAFAEIAAEVPPEAFDELPTDGSERHDDYIYGRQDRS